jgi:hypothetical protein
VLVHVGYDIPVMLPSLQTSETPYDTGGIPMKIFVVCSCLIFSQASIVYIYFLNKTTGSRGAEETVVCKPRAPFSGWTATVRSLLPAPQQYENK